MEKKNSNLAETQLEPKIVVGKFGQTYGLKGYLVIHSYTAPKENIFNYNPLFIKAGMTYQELIIRDKKQYINKLIALINDCNNPQDTKNYINNHIYVDYAQLVPLEKNSYYWHELIGLQVLDESNKSFGYISYIIETGANDVLVIEKPEMILIPFILNQVITKIDIKQQLMCIKKEQIVFQNG